MSLKLQVVCSVFGTPKSLHPVPITWAGCRPAVALLARWDMLINVKCGMLFYYCGILEALIAENRFYSICHFLMIHARMIDKSLLKFEDPFIMFAELLSLHGNNGQLKNSTSMVNRRVQKNNSLFYFTMTFF